MAFPAAKPIRVLLVDDHVVVRAGLRMIIQSRPGMAIVGEAGSRDEALALAAAEHPDIILLDLDLGGDSSIPVISELIAAATEARIIILTGLRDPEAHRQAVLLGAMGIVKKEKAAEVLINAIERVHAGEAWLDPSLMAGVLAEMTRASKGKRAEPEAEKIGALTNREREVIALIGEEQADRRSRGVVDLRISPRAGQSASVALPEETQQTEVCRTFSKEKDECLKSSKNSRCVVA